MNQRYFILAATVVGCVASACSKPPVPLRPRPMVNADSLRQDSIARALAESIRQAELARQQAEADRLRAAQEGNSEEVAETNPDAMGVLRATIYFAYDQASLTEAAIRALGDKLPVLQSNPNLNLLITGHTDSRGSAEYNIALGLRRAAMVKEWLVLNGVSASRLEIMSMGEESPVVFGENEDAWAQNRRAEFQVMGGN